MINFNQKFKHTKNWRKAALTFEREGRYCSHLTGSTDWIKFWEEEARRCMEGYEDPEAGWISGYHYFYLNYCVIKAQVKKLIKTRHGEVERTMREDRFPSFWDYDHYFFQAVQDAEDEGRHLAVIKARRKGYSYKNAAMMCRNYYFIPGAKNFAFASDEKFLVGDGIVFKA
jgi:hypothetical protein